MQPRFLVGGDLASEALYALMPAYRAPELGIYAVYPSRKHVSPKVRALVDFLGHYFSGAESLQIAIGRFQASP